MNPIDCLENSIEVAEISIARDEARDICRFGLVTLDKGDIPR